jgi:hypothetical protein
MLAVVIALLAAGVAPPQTIRWSIANEYPATSIQAGPMRASCAR